MTIDEICQSFLGKHRSYAYSFRLLLGPKPLRHWGEEDCYDQYIETTLLIGEAEYRVMLRWDLDGIILEYDIRRHK